MPSIVVDGVPYIPAEGTARIGVGITTHNRGEAFAQAFAEITRRTPNARIVVVDDASDTPVPEATYRFEENVGIAKAKNKCIELLSECEHIFLFDDDAWPLVDDWWCPYVESPEPHLMYLFKDPSGNPDVLYEDDKHFAYAESRGVMVYLHKSCIDRVGGMNVEFGRWGWEHPDLSNRIHAAGLTTWRFADVVGSSELIYSLDEQGKVTRSVDPKTRSELVEKNRLIHDKYRDVPAFMPYRETRDVVLTSFYNGKPDPQTGRAWRADKRQLTPLIQSLGETPLIVINDCFDAEKAGNVEYEPVKSSLSPYFQRWVSAYQWLRDHPDVARVWCVDATDVVQLQDPFPSMRPDRLYVGSEASVVGSTWMLKHHTAAFLQEFMHANADRQLLNAGLTGGSRDLVMQFAHDMASLYFDHETRRYFKHDTGDLGIGDMAAFNYLAYGKYGDRLEFGSRVNTVFKADRATDFSWWKHK